MGLDLLDLQFRVEKTFGVRLAQEALLRQDAEGRIRGPTAGEVLESILETMRAPSQLQHALRGIPSRADEEKQSGHVRQWTEEETWQALRGILVDLLCVQSERVTRDARLVEDLGAE